MKVKLTQLQGSTGKRLELEGYGNLPEVGLRVMVVGKTKRNAEYEAESIHTSRVVDIIEANANFTIFKTLSGSIYRMDHAGQLSGAV